MIEDDLDIYYHIINDKWYVSVEDYKKLKNRIDKAIEYIDRRDIDWGSEEHKKLLGILKGVDKE